MYLIVVHGPPAVGKYTVSRTLAERTGFPLLHNHLFFDFAAQLSQPFSEPFGELLQELRVLAVRFAAREGSAGAILTIYYDHPTDLERIEGLDSVVREYDGRLVAVQLVCGEEELRRRVTNPDRRAFGKVTDPDTLSGILERWNLYAAIPGFPSLRIDNGDRSVESAVDEIVAYYRLPERTRPGAEILRREE